MARRAVVGFSHVTRSPALTTTQGTATAATPSTIVAASTAVGMSHGEDQTRSMASPSADEVTFSLDRPAWTAHGDGVASLGSIVASSAVTVPAASPSRKIVTAATTGCANRRAISAQSISYQETRRGLTAD